MTQAYPLAWPKDWPRTTTPERSQFKTTLAGAIKNVQDSIRKFATDSGRRVVDLIVSSNATLVATAPKDAGVAVYFTWDGIPTCIAVDRYPTLAENLQAIHHVIEAERTKLRHGGLNLVRAAFKGYAALPPPKEQRAPHVILSVAPNATLEEIETAYKRLAKTAHPDHGGTPEKMQALTEARNQLKESLKKEAY